MSEVALVNSLGGKVTDPALDGRWSEEAVLKSTNGVARAKEDAHLEAGTTKWMKRLQAHAGPSWSR